MRTLQLQDHAQFPEGVEALVGEHLHEQVTSPQGVSLTQQFSFVVRTEHALFHQVLQDGRRIHLPGQGHLVSVQKPGDALGPRHGTNTQKTLEPAPKLLLF